MFAIICVNSPTYPTEQPFIPWLLVTCRVVIVGLVVVAVLGVVSI